MGNVRDINGRLEWIHLGGSGPGLDRSLARALGVIADPIRHPSTENQSNYHADGWVGTCDQYF